MHRARKVIKENFRNKKRLYRPYTQIVKDRWDKQLCKSIHAAAYSLNLAFQYDQDSFCQKPKVMVGLLDVIDHKFGGSRSKLIEETRIFHDKENGFGRQLALTIIKTTRQVDVDDDDGQGNGPSDSDDEDDLITYLEGLDLSSLCDARGGHTSGYCDEFDSGKD